MTVEVATRIPQLNQLSPLATDLLAEGDDQIRLLKIVLQGQFPGIGLVAVTASGTEMNFLVGVNSAIQTQLNNLLSLYASVTNGATLWVTGTTYGLGALVYSPTNYQTYRKTTASSVSTIDPINDSTNWTQLGGQVPDFLLIAQGVK